MFEHPLILSLLDFAKGGERRFVKTQGAHSIYPIIVYVKK
jgi:hypothetical protein